MQTWHSTNPALTAAFEPVFDERDDADLAIEGTLPACLRGVFMRNGPNPQFEPGPGYAYPYDGTGMIHAIHMDEGRARYSNRWVLTRELQEERKAGRRLYNTTFAPPPQANLVNTNVVRHAGRILALYEGGGPYELDESLATLGPCDFGGKLTGTLSAHPKIDPLTGELLALNYGDPDGTLEYLRVNAAGQVDRQVRIPAPWFSIVHDIGITASHVVAFLCPLVFDFSKGLAPPAWDAQRGTRILLIPRDCTDAGQVRWIETDPFFLWHVVNAHEKDGAIEAVMHWYDSFAGDKPPRTELRRLRIHPDSGRVEAATLDDSTSEFGRVNDTWVGRAARYCYAGLRDARPRETQQPGAFEAFVRHDMETGARTVYRLDAGRTAGEPVFAPDPRGTHEDDGYLLSFVHQDGKAGGEFIVLDARALDAGPVASIRLHRRVPVGLHGSWLPA